MRKLMSWLVALGLAVAMHAQDFTRTMSADEQAAAGLEKLSPEELAKLKAYVERYKSGAVATVQQQAEQKVAATEARAKEAERKVVAAEGKVKEAESKAAAEKPAGPSWLHALVTLKKAEAKPDAQEAMETRLAGTLTSFEGRRSFKLENGQVWQMVDLNYYAGPELERPAVRIRPGVLGTFWLQIPDASLRVKVKPVKLE